MEPLKDQIWTPQTGGPNDIKPDQVRPGHILPHQTGSHQNQTSLKRVKSYQVWLDQSQPVQSGSGQILPHQIESDQTSPAPPKTNRQSQTKLYQIGCIHVQIKGGQARAQQSQAGPGGGPGGEQDGSRACRRAGPAWAKRAQKTSAYCPSLDSELVRVRARVRPSSPEMLELREAVRDRESRVSMADGM